MSAVRRLIAHRRLALFLCLATLILKLIVPAGFMIGNAGGYPTIQWCPGVESDDKAAMRAMARAMPGMHATMPDHGRTGDHGKVEMPCAFAGLAAAALAGADAVLLAALIVYVLAAAWRRPVPPSPRPRPKLRPPLRGPPATA